ncbi:MAG TPA: hypothetical protein VFK06_22035 [Candidatus Angelobacter sp.]|nr:hypothetical protein [Candidatus Angelobacter sp.]
MSVEATLAVRKLAGVNEGRASETTFSCYQSCTSSKQMTSNSRMWKHKAKTKITKRNVPDRVVVLLIMVSIRLAKDKQRRQKGSGTVALGGMIACMKTREMMPEKSGAKKGKTAPGQKQQGGESA